MGYQGMRQSQLLLPLLLPPLVLSRLLRYINFINYIQSLIANPFDSYCQSLIANPLIPIFSDIPRDLTRYPLLVLSDDRQIVLDSYFLRHTVSIGNF